MCQGIAQGRCDWQVWNRCGPGYLRAQEHIRKGNLARFDFFFFAVDENIWFSFVSEEWLGALCVAREPEPTIRGSCGA